MNEYQVKKTPVEGLWELAQLDPVKYPHPGIFEMEGDQRVKQLAQFLQPTKSRPHCLVFKPGYHLAWHKDMEGMGRKIYHITHNLIMTGRGPGTLFLKTNKVSLTDQYYRDGDKIGTAGIYHCKPWTVYLADISLWHSSPFKSSRKRYFTRWNLNLPWLDQAVNKESDLSCEARWQQIYLSHLNLDRKN
jgi:hypothetical protein